MIRLSQARLPSLAAFERTEIAFVRQVCDSRRLSYCEAHHFRRAPGYSESCFVTDFNCNVDQVSLALQEIDDYYKTIGSRCTRISAAWGADAERMNAAILAAGYAQSNRCCFACPLDKMTAGRNSDATALMERDDFRILTARAMPRAYRRLLDLRSQSFADADRVNLTAIAMERLDDAQYEPYVALFADEPIGTAALHSVGDVGAIHEVFVIPSARRRGVAMRLVEKIGQTAKRWQFESVYADVADRDDVGRNLAHKCGFSNVGTIGQWRRAN